MDPDSLIGAHKQISLTSGPGDISYCRYNYIINAEPASVFSPINNSLNGLITGSDKTVTLSKLHAELSSVAEKWYYLGIQLKVSNKTLSVIRLINKSNEDVCLMRVCEEWLMQQKKSNIVPEWSTVIAVLRSRVISATALADELHQKYCCNDVEVDSDEEEQTSKSYTWVRSKSLPLNNIIVAMTSAWFNAALTDKIIVIVRALWNVRLEHID